MLIRIGKNTHSVGLLDSAVTAGDGPRTNLLQQESSPSLEPKTVPQNGQTVLSQQKAQALLVVRNLLHADRTFNTRQSERQ